MAKIIKLHLPKKINFVVNIRDEKIWLDDVWCIAILLLTKSQLFCLQKCCKNNSKTKLKCNLVSKNNNKSAKSIDFDQFTQLSEFSNLVSIVLCQTKITKYSEFFDQNYFLVLFQMISFNISLG